MSFAFYSRLTQVFGLMAIGVLFALVSFSAVTEIKDLDLWLHLKMGEIITTTAQVPAQDVLSATVGNKPWVNHEWLFQTVVYSVKAVFGFDGLLYMQSILVVLTFLLLLLWTYRRDRQLVIIPLLFSVLQVYQTRFTVRPDIFSLIFFILLLMVLMTSLERRWSLLALFVLQVIWGNMHGFFILGPLTVTIFLAAEALKRYAPLPSAWRSEGRLSDAGYQRLGIAWLVVLLATLFNPMTWEGAVYPFKVLMGLSGDNKVFLTTITELRPTVTWANVRDMAEQMPFKVLVIVSAISFVLNFRRVDVRLLLVWAVALIFGVVALRNMIYFAVVAYVVTLLNLACIDLKAMIPLRFVREEFEHLTGWMVKIVFMAYLVNYGGELVQYGYYDYDKHARKSEFFGVAQRVFPEGPVAFLVEHRIEGAVFNDFNTGAYLIGQAYPRVKVFMDGRTELYGAKFFKDVYNKIWDEGDVKALEAADSRYHLKAAVLGGSFSRPSEKVLKLFAGSKDWKLVYFDHDGLVFLRTIPEHAALIRKFGIDLKTWKSPSSDIRRTGAAKVTPFRETNRAVMLERLGYPDQALAQADAALAVSPLVQEAFEVKARIYAARDEHQNAFVNYRLALMQDSGNVKLRRGLALAYVGLGEYERALEEAENLDTALTDPSGPYVRAKVLVKKKQYPNAYVILVRRLFSLERGMAEIMAIGDLCVEQKAYDWAVRVYELAVRKDVKNTDAVKKLNEARSMRKSKK